VWRGLDTFDERASLRAWLYWIATNRCLTALCDRTRRPHEVPSMVEPPESTRRAAPIWLERPEPRAGPRRSGSSLTPTPGSKGWPTRASVVRVLRGERVGRWRLHGSAPAAAAATQRAALVLRDVLGFRAAEVTEMLYSSEASVKGALQRASETLDERTPLGGRDRAPAPRSARELELVARFAAAVERRDTEGVVSRLTMTPGSRCRPNRTSTKAGRRSPGSCTTAGAQRACSSCRPAPTGNLPAAATPDGRSPIARTYGIMVLTHRRPHLSHHVVPEVQPRHALRTATNGSGAVMGLSLRSPMIVSGCGDSHAS
jgi:DNA-directed RNA polymerase specialized sigma24 family protein